MVLGSFHCPPGKVSPGVLRRALQNFFRWNGAPWFEGAAPDPDETAVALHSAFLRPSIHRTYFVPLDRLRLEDTSSGTWREVTSVRFGPNEVERLDRYELARRVPIDALRRFGVRYRFPIEELDGFCWLATSCTKPPGPLERRTLLNLLNVTMRDVGTVELFRSTFPTAVEHALFALLLILVRDPEETPWKPFRVPWIFSVTDDLFSDADAAPDASVLTRRPYEDEHGYSELPDDSEVFEFGAGQFEALRRRWNDLETMLATADTDDTSFHPLTGHFLVKALSEHGVDEILANLSCLEATLMLKERGARNALKHRCARLVPHDETRQWLDDAYWFRDHYLHSLTDAEQRLSWTHLARTRWVVATAVGRYLDFAVQRPELSRLQLLRCLDP